jgi:hypothetical protein
MPGAYGLGILLLISSKPGARCLTSTNKIHNIYMHICFLPLQAISFPISDQTSSYDRLHYLGALLEQGSLSCALMLHFQFLSFLKVMIS